MVDALRRLDALLLRVCDAEEQRARRMYTEDRGWASLRSSLAPPAAELAFDAMVPETPLATRHTAQALARLIDALELTQLEADALIVLLAPYLEPRYGKLYAVLLDDPAAPHLTERLVFTVLGRSPARAAGIAAALADDGRLCGAGLIARASGWYGARARPIDLAPEVRDALLGLPRPAALGELELAWRSSDGDDDGGGDDGDGDRGGGGDDSDDDGADDGDGDDRDGDGDRGGDGDDGDGGGGGGGGDAPALQVVWGPGDRDAVAAARSGGRDRLAIRPQAPLAAGLLEAAWRIAVLHGAALQLDLTRLGSDEAARSAGAAQRLIARWGGAAILEHDEPLAIAAVHHHAPLPGFADRRAEWASAAEVHGVALTDGELDRLAGNHPITGPQLAAVFAAAGGAGEGGLNRAAHRLRRFDARHASRREPGRTFDDLVLRASTREALERLIYYVAHRDGIAEQRGLEARFRMQRGPVVMFAGRSGTGKTLAAEVVAGAVGRPLAVVDLSRLVSKYIGETEKHIDEILRAAERSGTVLFFDEADALFSSRTEVSSSNDRYANLEVGYLLQRIEQHDGLVILATNLRNGIDDAFQRRFHARIEFPFPDPEERRALWELMLGGANGAASSANDAAGGAGGAKAAARGANDAASGAGGAGSTCPAALDPRELARYRLAGGDIRNAALKAIFLAEREGAPLGLHHVERAVALELYELGRLSRHDAAPTDAGRLLREVVEGIEVSLEGELARRFLKEIHFVHGAPTKEAMAGRRPAVSAAVFRMAAESDGTLRLGLIVSTWSNRPEEEVELLGVLHELFARLELPRARGKRPVLHVQRSFDFDLLHRFWSSHGHPMRPSLVVDVELRA